MVARILVLFKSLALVSILLTSFNANAAVSAFVGSSTNYAGLGALRIGVDAWEFGIYGNGAIGMNKVFKGSSSYYSTFGFGVNSVLSPSILAGVGFNYLDFVGFGLRGELLSITSVGGKLYGAGTLGVSWNF